MFWMVYENELWLSCKNDLFSHCAVHEWILFKVDSNGLSNCKISNDVQIHLNKSHPPFNAVYNWCSAVLTICSMFLSHECGCRHFKLWKLVSWNERGWQSSELQNIVNRQGEFNHNQFVCQCTYVIVSWHPSIICVNLLTKISWFDSIGEEFVYYIYCIYI